MCRNSFNYHTMIVILLVFDLFCQVVSSDYCGDDKYCESPYKCCTNRLACCYDDTYTKVFKFHVWNMWYFWVAVIFIMMSCFGVCGYYRRRRLAAMQQSLSSPESPRRVCTTGQRLRRRGPTPQPGLYAYTGPGADTTSDMHLPPPYTEVMQQPNLYPVNKVELPPYPGPPVNKDLGSGVAEEEEMVSPPPYCEVMPPSTPQSERESASTAALAEHMESRHQDENGSNVGDNADSTQAAQSS